MTTETPPDDGIDTSRHPSAGTEHPSSLTELPTPPAEAALRAALAEIRTSLADARTIRDAQNEIIRGLRPQEELLAQAVGVFDRAAKKATAGPDAAAPTNIASKRAAKRAIAGPRR